MDYVIISLLGLIVVLLVVILILTIIKKNNNDMVEKLGKFETDLTKEIGEFKFSFSRTLTSDFEKLNERIENRAIKDMIENNISEYDFYNKYGKYRQLIKWDEIEEDFVFRLDQYRRKNEGKPFMTHLVISG